MLRNETQETFDLVLKAFTEAAQENYDYAYVAGYLRSLNVQLIGMVPKKYQQGFIDAMIHATKKQESEVIAKRDQNRVFERV